MGTRADFYIGRGRDAKWIGSIALDGYPGGIDEDILTATEKDIFAALVAGVIAKRNDGTTPEMGWPWPWETSATTNYAYAFDGDKVWGSYFGGTWFEAAIEQGGDEEPESEVEAVVFPRFDTGKATLGPRSGLLILRG